MKLFSVLLCSQRSLLKAHLSIPRTFVSMATNAQLESTINSIHSISANPYFSLLRLCRTLSSLQKFHALLIIDGQIRDVQIKAKLMGSYGLYGRVKTARLLFDEIPSPDLTTCKVMIRWYFMNDLYADVIGFYHRFMKRLDLYDNVVLSIVVKACCELRDVVEGCKVHCHVVKVGNPDRIVLTGLLDMYAKCGDIESSNKVFEGIVDRNVVCWTSMIVGYVQNGCAEEALVYFNKMRDGLVEGNEYTLGTLVSGCAQMGAIHQGKWLHGYIIKKQIDLGSHLVAALVDMYVKCKSLTDARKILSESPEFNLISWTAMIVGYTQNGCPSDALELFVDKNWEAVLPNTVTVSSVVSACGQLGYGKFGASVHSLCIKLRLDDDAVTNALVHMYGKCGMRGVANYLFQTISEKDVVSWNSIISIYSSSGSAHEAVALFLQMRLELFQPDAITLVSVITACASHGAVVIGSSLHAYSVKEGFLVSTHVSTALLNLYAKCGDAKSARAVFDGILEKNTVTWNAMIGGYGFQGDCESSLALLNDMMRESLEPNDVMFTAVLSACSHAGMIIEGWNFFASMCQEYNFIPSMKHYACMVDLLARAGKLDEALDLLNKMPILPDVALFGAFLNGCSIHSRFDLGEVAVRRMLDLHPHDACYYVLMANMYASDGRWNQAHHMRDLMRRKGLKKSPGFSNLNSDFDGDFYPHRVASFA